MLTTDGGGQGECLGLPVYHPLNRPSRGAQEHHCFLYLNADDYVRVTVLICDRHHLWENVGHMFMHNKRSRPQPGRLAPTFSCS